MLLQLKPGRVLVVDGLYFAKQYNCAGTLVGITGTTNSPMSIPSLPPGNQYSVNVLTLGLPSNDYVCGLPDYSHNDIYLYCGPTQIAMKTQVGNPNTDQNFNATMTVSGCTIIGTNVNLTFNSTNHVVNNTGRTMDYILTDAAGNTYGYLQLPPGGSGNVIGTGEPYGVQINEQSYPDIMSPIDNVNPFNNDQYQTNYNVQPGQGQTNQMPIVSTYATNQQVSGAYMGTNGLIIWTSNNMTGVGSSGIVFDPNVNATLQAGFNVLSQNQKDQLAAQIQANQLLGLFATNRSSYAVISNSLSGLIVTNILTGNFNFPSNLTLNMPTNLTVTASNVLSLTNYASESTLAGLSNLLGTASLSNIDQNGSAGLGSGIMGVVMSNLNNYLPGYRTNGDALFAAGSGAETNYDQSGKMDLLGNAPSIQPDDQAAPSMMVLDFCGTDLDLNPVNMFPYVATASHLGFTIVAEIAFLFFAGRLFWECVRAKGATQQGAVPNLMALGGGEILGIGGEVGGNFLGVITALLIPAMFIGLFYGVLAYVFSVIGFSISDAFNISAFQSTLGEIGLYLLGAYIPVNVLFTLACLSVTMQFTMAKFYNIACNCARYLWGG